MNKTEIIYVVSPDWYRQFFVSLHSLLESKSSFDTIRIFCIGKKPKEWVFLDPRIVVDEVERLDENNYFLINKTYITKSQADRVIFLDADTLVLKPLDQVWKGINADFIGRVESVCSKPQWNQQSWLALLQKLNAVETPYFNSGFVIFQNGSHRNLFQSWYTLTKQGQNKELFDSAKIHNNNPRMAEQIALSLAIGCARLSWHKIGNKEHAYGWRLEPYTDSIVLHTGNWKYYEIASLAMREKNIRFVSPICSSGFDRRHFSIHWKLFKGDIKRIINRFKSNLQRSFSLLI